MSRPCSRCKDRPNTDGTYCKPCRTIRNKEYREKNLELVRSQRKRAAIKHQYGLSLDAYDAMIEEGCAVCGSYDRLAIDHDHACCPDRVTCGNCIRGVLCRNHNIVLGLVKDSPEELKKLIDYLAQ